MALTVTSRGTGTHNTGATTLVPGGRNATLAVGSLGVLCMAADNAGSAGSALMGPATWNDVKGNVWTVRQDALYDNGAASAGVEMLIYTAPITVALLTTDAGTITWAGGVSPVAKVWTWYEVIPSNGVTPVYFTGGTIAGATAANAQVTTASVTVGDAVIAGYFSENTSAVTGDSDTTNGTWAAQQTATVGTTTSGVIIATQAKVQMTTPSTQSYDATVASQDRIAGYIMVHEVLNTAAVPSSVGLVTSLSTPIVIATAAKISIPGSVALTTSLATPIVTTTANVATVPASLALTATGVTPTVSAPALSLVGSVGLTLSLAIPVVVAVQRYVPDPVALVTSMATPVVLLPVASVPDSVVLVLTPAIPVVTAPRVSLPTSVDLTMTPATPTVAAVQRYAPTAVALVLTGATPQIGGSVSVIPVAASLSFAGDVPAVRTPVALDPSAVALFLAFAGPVVIATDNLRLTPGPLGLVLTPAIPDVTIPSLMPGIAARMHIVAMPPLQLAIAPRPAAAVRVLPASDAPATSPGDSR